MIWVASTSSRAVAKSRVSAPNPPGLLAEPTARGLVFGRLIEEGLDLEEKGVPELGPLPGVLSGQSQAGVALRDRAGAGFLPAGGGLAHGHTTSGVRTRGGSSV